MALGPMVVETGAGLANANSFASLVEAEAYFDGHPSYTTWQAVEPTAKEAALMTATRYLCRAVRWLGSISVSTQALAWPRAYVYDREGRAISSTTVPQQVKDAVCELALAMRTKLDPGSGLRLVTSETVGPVSYTYGDRRGGVDAFGLPTVVATHIADLVDYERRAVRA